MAVADIIEQTKAPLLQRADELRPQVQEYNDIMAVLERFEDSTPTSRPGRRARTSAPAAPARRKATRRPRQGGRKDQVLNLVRSRPGITIPEMAQEMGIKDNYLYRVTSELLSSGVLKKEDRGYFAV